MPFFGLATGALLGVLTDAWLIASLALTVIAAAILAMAILPGQQRMLALTQDSPSRDGLRSTATRLTMLTGIFNVLWAIVVILMIVRPGSTTGA